MTGDAALGGGAQSVEGVADQAGPPATPFRPEERALEKDARLRRFILRIERLEEEKAALAEDIREVYAEAKATGYETRYMRTIVRLRKMEPDQRDEQDHCVDLYRKACGIGRRRHDAAEGENDGDKK